MERRFPVISFVISEAFKNVWRSKFSGLLTILSMSFALFLVNIIATASKSLESVLGEFKNESPATIYFSKDYSEKNAQKVIKKIKLISQVKSVEFLSKEKALRIYDKKHRSDIKAILGENPLPHSAIIYLKKKQARHRDFIQLRNKIHNIDKKIEVTYQSTTILRLERYFSYFVKASLILTGIVIFVSIILVVNTIRLSIHDKRLIIRTMSLVGAKNIHIKMPFMLESIIQAILSFSVVYSVFYGLEYFLVHRFKFDLIFYPYQEYALLGLAVLMAMFGALISVRKYLKWNFR
jgi:cell division transport system permease protein